MLEAEPFLLFTRKLSDLGLRFMVSGSLAAIYYGEPRMTNHVDIVLVLPEKDLRSFVAAFPPEEFYCPPLDILRIEQAREERGHINLIHHESGFKADLYFAQRDDLHRWGLDHLRAVEFGDDTIPLAPPEYVIIRKLQFYREGRSEKHLRDIQRMLLGLGDAWDRQVLTAYIARFGLEEEWTLVPPAGAE